MVLLKNEGGVLPLDPVQEDGGDRPARREPARHARPVVGRGRDNDVVTVFDGINDAEPRRDLRRGLHALATPRSPHADPEGCGSDAGFAEAVAAAQAADQVVLALGETREMSGEADVAQHARPAGQAGGADRRDQGDRQAVRGRALQRPPAGARERRSATRRRSSRRGSPASRRGHAVADVLFGKVNPGGKLPVSFPRRSARCRSTTTTSRPGGPCNPDVKWNSRHRDIPSCAPLFEFGYGLSYTTFEITTCSSARRACRRTGA